jgi:hypothetical protein
MGRRARIPRWWWRLITVRGDGSTGLMKVVFCYALPTVVQGFGANETLHFRNNHILGTTAFGDGCVTVWGCFSVDCKLNLYVLDGNLTGQKYRGFMSGDIAGHGIVLTASCC